MASDDPAIRLTSTSYVVLGMLEWLGPSSPYRLKRYMANSVEDFFPLPHTSFYAEPARLAAAGYLDEEQEESGRRRKRYALNDRGRAALAQWLAESETPFGQFRFPGIVKVFFGGDPAAFAGEHAAHHRALAEKFEAIRDRDLPMAPNHRLILDTGIRLHRWWADTWEQIDREGRG